MDAFEFAAGNRQIARLGRAGRQNHGVEFLQQFFRRIIFADLGVADKFDAFGFHLFDAAQDDLLLVELHVRDAIHEQAAGAVGALENGDEVAGLVQLRGGAKSRRAGADDGDFFAGALFGGSGTTQPSSQPWSMMAHSMFLMVTGGLLMPSTHEPSHGAGQTRPVNSGKLFVLCSRSSASFHRPR